jgi:hypothetical protein
MVKREPQRFVVRVQRGDGIEEGEQRLAKLGQLICHAARQRERLSGGQPPRALNPRKADASGGEALTQRVHEDY